VINDESEENDEKRVVATNKINYKLRRNTIKEATNKPKVDGTYKRCMTRMVRNTKEESGRR